jgi:hypothetical protein
LPFDLAQGGEPVEPFRVSDFEFRISGQAENQKRRNLPVSGLSGSVKELVAGGEKSHVRRIESAYRL